MASPSDAQLSVLIPIEITDAKFISSTQTENDTDDGPQWLVGTSYTVGQQVRQLHVVYQCVVANVGKDPSLVIYNAGDNAVWTKVRPTNKWAAVDDETSTATVSIGTSTLTMVFQPGFFTGIGVLAMDGDVLHISVDVQDTGENLYTYDGTLEASLPDDYWEYCFDPFIQQTNFIATDIAPYNNALATVTISKATGTVGIGMVVFGDLRALGTSQYGAKVAPKSYAYVDIDNYGESTIVRGKKATDVTVTARLKTYETPAVVQILQQLMDVPALWFGANLSDYSLTSFGLGSGDVTYDNYSDALLSVSIDGMI